MGLRNYFASYNFYGIVESIHMERWEKDYAQAPHVVSNVFTF